MQLLSIITVSIATLTHSAIAHTGDSAIECVLLVLTGIIDLDDFSKLVDMGLVDAGFLYLVGFFR